MSTSIVVVVVVVGGVVSAIMPPRHPIVAASVIVDAAAQHYDCSDAAAVTNSRDNYFDVDDYDCGLGRDSLVPPRVILVHGMRTTVVTMAVFDDYYYCYY